MPSVFDIFGEINLESSAFENSLRSVDAKLRATDATLDQTIARSNKLGDTSATVARRYDRLSESIKVQRQRLLDNALAFEKGEINARKFSSVVTSVDKATEGLNSRLRDAKARLTELDETGLTHFQQQVQGSVGPRTTDIFKRLSAQQKTQLSFQVNDIITGLASGQNPLQILAQQGGQIVQIFQMSKTAQEGVATATTAAATAEAAFATSASAAATSQSAVAASSAATAASMEGASAAATILGASVVSLGAVLAAGLVTILAVWKATKDIEESAQKRLQYEELVTGEYNKQNLFVGELARKREEAAAERSFNKLLATGSPFEIERKLAAVQAQYDAAAAKAAEVARRQRATDQVILESSQGLFGFYSVPQFAVNTQKQLKAERAAAENEARSFQNQIIDLDAALENANARDADRHERFLKFADSVNLESRIKATNAYYEQRNKLIEESIKKAKEWAEHVKNAIKTVESIVIGTSDNPFVKIFNDGTKAVNSMLEATKGLGSELQNNLRKLLESDTATKAFKQSMENALRSSDLRSEAAQFLGGQKETVSESLQRSLNAIGGGSRFLAQDFSFVNGQVGARILPPPDADQRARDQKIIELTRGIAIEELTSDQRQIAAAARLREATALDREKSEAIETQKKLVEVLNKLAGIKDHPEVTIKIVKKTNLAEVYQTPSQDDVNDEYGNPRQ